MTAAALLLALLGLANYGADILAAWPGGGVAAWDYVLQGVQAAGLWLTVAALATGIEVRAVAVLGALVAAQRPVCRSLFDMASRPQLQDGQSLCEAVDGQASGWLEIIAVLFVAALVREMRRA